jgi:TPR repeat protein
MHNLGVLFRLRGEGAEAEVWYQRAAELGHPGAMHNLGALLHGRGNEAEAKGWWRQAADLGNTASRHNLGVLQQRAAQAEMDVDEALE